MSVQLLLPKRLKPDKLRDLIFNQVKSISRNVVLEKIKKSRLPDKVEILQKIIENEKEIPSIRHQAISCLWRINSPSSKLALLNVLNLINDNKIQRPIISILGRIGDVRTLEQIEKNIYKFDRLTINAAQFSSSLIRYRYSLPGEEISPVKKKATESKNNITKMRINIPNFPEIRKCLSDVRRDPIGVALTFKSMVQLNCEAGQRMVILSKEYSRVRAFKKLFDRKVVLGIIAHQHLNNFNYFPAGYILCHPMKHSGKINIIVTRMNGEQDMIGKANFDNGYFHFHLNGVNRYGGSYSYIDGIYGDGEIRINQAFGGKKTIRKRLL